MARKDGLTAEGPQGAAAQRRHERRGDKSDALRRGLERALEATKAKRDKSAAAAKAKGGGSKKPKQPKQQQGSDRMMVNQTVGKDTQKHGDYRAVGFKLQEVTEGGKRVEKTIRVVRNYGGSPIERWHAKNALDERQMAAILFYQNAWRMWIGEPRVVANWSAVIVRQAHGAVEIYAGTRMAAKESLRLLDQEVFFREPVDHFQVWQNVVIFDEPAGVAGGRVGFMVKKSAEAAARIIVGSMAHKIADIVIDQSRRDFGDLLLDLDAPRRPRRRA